MPFCLRASLNFASLGQLIFPENKENMAKMQIIVCKIPAFREIIGDFFCFSFGENFGQALSLGESWDFAIYRAVRFLGRLLSFKYSEIILKCFTNRREIAII